MRDRVLQLRRRREVTQLRDYAWDIAAGKVTAAKVGLDQKLRRSTGSAPAADAAAEAAGIGLDALAGHARTPPAHLDAGAAGRASTMTDTAAPGRPWAEAEPLAPRPALPGRTCWSSCS